MGIGLRESAVFGALFGQRRTVLLEAHHVGCRFLHETQHLARRIPARIVREVADVVGHEQQRPPLLGLRFGIPAPEFGLIEKRHAEESAPRNEEHRQGTARPPAHDPVEREQHGRQIGRRSNQSEHGKEPYRSGIHIGCRIGQQQRRGHGGRQHGEHAVGHAADQRAPRRSLAAVRSVEIPFHRLRTRFRAVSSTSRAGPAPTACRRCGRSGPRCRPGPSTP